MILVFVKEIFSKIALKLIAMYGLKLSGGGGRGRVGASGGRRGGQGRAGQAGDSLTQLKSPAFYWFSLIATKR